MWFIYNSIGLFLLSWQWRSNDNNESLNLIYQEPVTWMIPSKWISQLGQKIQHLCSRNQTLIIVPKKTSHLLTPKHISVSSDTKLDALSFTVPTHMWYAWSKKAWEKGDKEEFDNPNEDEVIYTNEDLLVVHQILNMTTVKIGD